METMTMNRHFKKGMRLATVAGFFLGLIFWHVAQAATTFTVSAPDQPAAQMSSPEAPAPHESLRATVTAYTSSPDETDARPHENASGSKPGPGSIACPSRYEFGTEVLIKGKTYVCDDRMNARYAGGDYFDVWMPSKKAAFTFGRQRLDVKVLD